VEALVKESIDRAEEDFQARQVTEARVEADHILAAVEKARQHDAYYDLSELEKQQIQDSVNQLMLAYHTDDYLLIRAQIDLVNKATMKLAETMMNEAVRGALKGTKI
jgi:molecular chaperone DnaK